MITKAEISLVRSLTDKHARTESGLFVVEGRKMVGEAIASGLTVRRIFGTEEFASVAGCEVVGRKDIERMSSLRTPQGILALVEMPRRPLPRPEAGALTIALDGVQDPGNMGTIIRLADWFGIGSIVCSPETADCFNPKVVQATMGAIFRIPIYYTQLGDYLASAGEVGIPVFGTFLEGDDIYSAGLGGTPSGIVVMGNEGNGISPAVARAVTRKLYIPPFPADKPSSESLNVATATAIICSEFRRPAAR